MVYLSFYKKMKEFLRPVFFFIFTEFLCFQGPVGAMCISVGKCSRMYLRAARIHKISGGLGGPGPLAHFWGLG